jgi:cytoskeletal protein CcmA (bactofilin family)
MWKKEDAKGNAGVEEGMMDDKSSKPSASVSDKAADVIAFVGKGVEFKGTIIYSGTVRIDGQLEGEIETDGVLIIGEGAVISAKVTAGTIICQGRITGDVLAKEKIKLLSPAVMNGSVSAPLLSIEEGVLFNGSLEMKRPDVREVPRELARDVRDVRDSLVRAIGDTRSASFPSARS